MNRTKKTTLLLDEALLDQIKSRAVSQGTSASRVVAEALQEYLVKREAPRRSVKLTTFRGDGWVAPVDMNDTSAVMEHLDEVDNLPWDQTR